MVDVEMSDEIVKEEGKEEAMPAIKVSESLKKFIEQDNKVYEEEVKQVKNQEKTINAEFFREL